MKIAVIGTGISGLAISYILSKNHQLTIYEKNDYIGGHSRTITPKINEKEVPVDTGFIVFNKKNYPNLVSLFNHLNIEYSESSMSFGVSINSGKLEYGTSNLSSMFAQKSNLFNLQFLLMIKDIFKFYKNAKNYRNIDLTVGQMLEEMKLGEYFKNNFLLPIAASIWSSKSSQILDFPTSTFVNFFDNHGLLSVSNQPQWYSVIGGSKNYVSKLSKSFKDRIHLSRPALSANRVNEKVEIIDSSGNKELYDNVIFACHSNQTMKIIQDANDEEKNIIGNIKYQKNK
ncbi:MAG: NAD(P)-binding protein, partial [Pseudomonadota bacterium]